MIEALLVITKECLARGLLSCPNLASWPGRSSCAESLPNNISELTFSSFNPGVSWRKRFWYNLCSLVCSSVTTPIALRYNSLECLTSQLYVLESVSCLLEDPADLDSSIVRCPVDRVTASLLAGGELLYCFISVVHRGHSCIQPSIIYCLQVLWGAEDRDWEVNLLAVQITWEWEDMLPPLPRVYCLASVLCSCLDRTLSLKIFKTIFIICVYVCTHTCLNGCGNYCSGSAHCWLEIDCVWDFSVPTTTGSMVTHSCGQASDWKGKEVEGTENFDVAVVVEICRVFFFF